MIPGAWKSLFLTAGLAFIAGLAAPASAQIVVNSRPARGAGVYRGAGPHGGHGRGRIITNVHPGPDSLHRPWIGSDTYEKNLGRKSTDGGRSDFQRDRDSTLDSLHREENRARRIRDAERARDEMRADVRAAKEEIERRRARAKEERRERERERSEDIRRRAAEQEASIRRRQEQQEAVHDAVLNALPPCAGRCADGSPCRRKALPGSHFCHLHQEDK